MAGHLPGRGFESLPESLSFFSPLYFLFLILTFLSDFDLGLRSDCQVWSMLKIWASVPPHRTCQLGIRFGWIPGSSALSTRIWPLSCRVTSVAQLVRAWQAKYLPGRGFESLPESLSFFRLFIFSSLFLTFLSDFDSGLRSDCQVWSMLKIWASCVSRSPHPPSPPPHTHIHTINWCIERGKGCRTAGYTWLTKVQWVDVVIGLTIFTAKHGFTCCH